MLLSAIAGALTEPARCLRRPHVAVRPRCRVRLAYTPDVDAASGENVDAGVYIAESPGKGLGAFALRDFAKGDMLDDYAGDLLSEDQLQARYSGGELGSYIMAIDDDWYIDAEYPSASNWCRYVNHSSKKENLVVVRDVPARRCILVTTRAIDAHEELYLDYGPNYWKPAHNRMLDDVLYYGAEYKPVLAEEPD